MILHDKTIWYIYPLLISEELLVQVSKSGRFSMEESGLLANEPGSGEAREQMRGKANLVNQSHLMLPSLGHDPNIRGSK
jgi:hypothetical protein